LAEPVLDWAAACWQRPHAGSGLDHNSKFLFPGKNKFGTGAGLSVQTGGAIDDRERFADYFSPAFRPPVAGDCPDPELREGNKSIIRPMASQPVGRDRTKNPPAFVMND